MKYIYWMLSFLLCTNSCASAECLLGNCTEGRSVVKIPFQERTNEETGEQYTHPGGFYIGDMSAGAPNGIGILKWMERKKNSTAFSEWMYVGHFKDGEPQGRGIARRTDGSGTKEIFVGDFNGGIYKAKIGTIMISFKGIQDISVYKVGSNNSVIPHENNTISLYCRFQANRLGVPERCKELSPDELNDRADAMIEYIYSCPIISERASSEDRTKDPIDILNKFFSGVNAQSGGIISLGKNGQRRMDEMFDNPRAAARGRR
jgi:hypothetical protein